MDLTRGTDADDQVARPHRGAVFLANLDDDARRCPPPGSAATSAPGALAACHDAADEVVNGAADEADLAPVRSTPHAVPADARGRIVVEGEAARHTHLFLKRAGTWAIVRPDTVLTAAELRAGLVLGLEGTDILRDDSWDGRARVTLTVTAQGRTQTSSVMLRQAPLVMHDHTQALSSVVVPDASFVAADATASGAAAAAATVTRMQSLLKARGVDSRILTGAQDAWPQDAFEAMYQQMPGAAGAPQSMRVLVLTDQTRGAHPAVYALRGPGVAVVRSGDQEGQPTLDSGGNIETLPPYADGRQEYPLGRAVIGHRETDPADYPRGTTPAPSGGDGGPAASAATPHRGPSNMVKPGDPGHISAQGGDHDHDDDGHDHDGPDQATEPSARMMSLLKAQTGVEPLLLDTGFLAVGHVDEFMHVIPADTPRRWRIAVADPLAGLAIMEKLNADGHGDLPIMEDSPTIAQDLADGQLARHNRQAAAIIDKNVQRLTAATGLQSSEIVRVPVFFRPEIGDHPDRVDPNDNHRMAAYLPNAVNALVLDKKSILVSQQHGPRVGGRDVMQEAVTRAYAKAGLAATFIDDFDLLHRGGGNVHCGTNALRAMTPRVLSRHEVEDDDSGTWPSTPRS